MSLAFGVSQLAGGLQQLVENNNQGSSTNSCVVSMSGVLYYITIAQTGTTQATGNLWILKSYDAGASWSLIYNSSRGYTGGFTPGFQQLAVCPSGTNIYIVVQPGGTTGAVVLTFQTPSDTFAADSAAGPVGQVDSFSALGAAAFADGTLLVAGQNTATSAVAVARYNPGTTTWSAAATIEAASFNNGIAAVIAEPVTNRAYVFYTSAANFTTFTLKCAPITSPTTVGTIQTLGTLTSDGITPAVAYLTGIPCVTSSEVIIPVLASKTTTVLSVYRASFGTNPAFSSETVQTGITGKTPPTRWPFPLPSCAAVRYNGSTYVFYSLDNGAFPTALCQGYLYYQSNTGAGLGWSTATLVYTSPLSREPLVQYPVLVTSTQLGVLWLLGDPTRFFDTSDPEAKINALGPYFLVEANQFSLQKVVVAMKPNRHLPVRGAAQ